MAYCPKCNGEIGQQETVCAHCGYDFPPAELRKGLPRDWNSWRSPVSILLCLIGTCFILLLDAQHFTHSLVFLFCWVTSLIIWLPELWRSRYGVPGRLAFFAALHLVLITWVFLCLPRSYEHQTRYNKAWEDRHKTIEHTEIHNTE